MRALRKLSGVLQKYRLQVLLALLTTLGLTAASLAIPRIIQQVIDTGLAQNNRSFILRAALAIAALGLVYLGVWLLTLAMIYATGYMIISSTYLLATTIMLKPDSLSAAASRMCALLSGLPG